MSKKKTKNKKLTNNYLNNNPYLNNNLFAGGGPDFANMTSSEMAKGVGTTVGGVAGMIGASSGLLQTKDTSMLENAIDNQNNYISSANSNADIMNEFSNFNGLDRTSMSQLGQSGGEIIGGIGKDAAAGAAAGSMFGGIGAGIGAGVGALAGGVSSFLGQRKARKKMKKLNDEIDAANARKWSTLNNQANNIDTRNDSLLQASYYDLGGKLSNHGANWDNGILDIANGGTHEANPNHGVQIGVDKGGKPNLVEEGEVVWNDYVFSNRIDVPDEIKKQYKLTGKTFADNAKSAMKESEERPNDSISKAGVDKTLGRLARTQEALKQVEEVQKAGNNQFAVGGDTNDNNYLDFNAYQKSLMNKSPFGYHQLTLFGRPVEAAEEENSRPEHTLQYDFNYNPVDLSDYHQKPRIDRSNEVKLTPLNSDKFTPNFVTKGQAYTQGIPVESYLNKNSTTKSNPKDASMLRYAPALGSALGVINDITGGSKPEYANANVVASEAKKAGKFTPVSYSPIGNKLSYDPFDREYAQNRLNAIAGRTSRDIMNNSGGNRAAANAGLLAADYNAQKQSGELARKADEYNRGEKARVEAFNRQTNSTNAQGFMQASGANQTARRAANSAELQGMTQSMNMRNIAKAQSNAVKSSNLTNLFTNLGNIGIDTENKDVIKNLALSGVFGTLNDDMKKYLGIKAKGGKITRKRKKGLTY